MQVRGTLSGEAGRDEEGGAARRKGRGGLDTAKVQGVRERKPSV